MKTNGGLPQKEGPVKHVMNSVGTSSHHLWLLWPTNSVGCSADWMTEQRQLEKEVAVELLITTVPWQELSEPSILQLRTKSRIHTLLSKLTEHFFI